MGQQVKYEPGAVTVVIPTIQGRDAMLARAVDSVARQTRPATVLVAADKRHREGAWVTRNRGALDVITEWTAFLDDDDELMAHHVAHLVGKAETEELDLVWGWFRVESTPGRRPQAFDPWPENRGRDYDPSDPHVVPITYIVRTELLHASIERVGGFLPDTIGAWQHQDQPLFHDLAVNGRHGASRKTTWIWHWHPSNTSGLPDR